MSRFFPILSRRLRCLAMLLALGACDSVRWLAGDSDPRLCGVPPWHNSPVRSDADLVNRNLARCLWIKSRQLARAPATNEELARAIVGGCWERLSAWGRVVSPTSDMEEIDRLVARLDRRALYWVVEARTGHCTLRNAVRPIPAGQANG